MVDVWLTFIGSSAKFTVSAVLKENIKLMNMRRKEN